MRCGCWRTTMRPSVDAYARLCCRRRACLRCRLAKRCLCRCRQITKASTAAIVPHTRRLHMYQLFNWACTSTHRSPGLLRPIALQHERLQWQKLLGRVTASARALDCLPCTVTMVLTLDRSATSEVLLPVATNRLELLTASGPVRYSPLPAWRAFEFSKWDC